MKELSGVLQHFQAQAGDIRRQDFYTNG